MGAKEHDSDLFQKHLKWVAETPYVVSFGGGDLFDNLTPQQAVKMGQNVVNPEEQLWLATKTFAKVQHKMAFSILGNHEARSARASGIDSAKQLASNLKLPYFSDYAFVIIKWRQNKFRLLVHHGSGGAQTAGAQRNAARKDMAWAGSPDLIWTGHLHKALTDTVYQVDRDQKTGRAFERNAFVLISPAYLKYFGGYGAAHRMAPDSRGMTVVTMKPNGTMEALMHARGQRK